MPEALRGFQAVEKCSVLAPPAIEDRRFTERRRDFHILTSRVFRLAPNVNPGLPGGEIGAPARGTGSDHGRNQKVRPKEIRGLTLIGSGIRFVVQKKWALQGQPTR